jgi:hypothetical protein
MIHRDRVFVPLMPLVVHYPMTLKARVPQEVVVVILFRDLLVVDRRHALQMIEVGPDLLVTKYVADLGNEPWHLPSELRPCDCRIGTGQELFADQVVQSGEDAVLNSDTASCHALLLPDVLELVLGHSALASGRRRDRLRQCTKEPCGVRQRRLGSTHARPTATTLSGSCRSRSRSMAFATCIARFVPQPSHNSHA